MSEFGLGMQSSLFLVLQQDGLPRLKHSRIFENDPCHIYMISRRSRISLMPETIQITEYDIQCNVKVQNESKSKEYRVGFANNVGTTNFKIECSYPHTEFKVVLAGGSVFSEGKVANLMHFAQPYAGYLDLEVLYIGQSFGVDGAKYAPERLVSHSTLQGIYAEAMRQTPDKEIWLVLCSFQEIMMVSFDGSSEYKTTNEEDDEHMFRVLNTEVSLQQKINFTEAALIKYFRPEYNRTFKNNFPNPAHSTYKECYDLEINQVHVELDTELLGCRLWSPAIEAGWNHIAVFPLWSKEDRKDMFDFGVLGDFETFTEYLQRKAFPEPD